MEYVLKTQNLQKKYRHFCALSGVDMNVPKGAVYGFVGKNGAGKTTLIRLICGLQDPTDGVYKLYGTMNKDKSIREARRRMGAVVEVPSLYPDLTARGNLEQQYRMLGLPNFDGIDEILKIIGLENTGKKRARNFSLGMKQRLGIGVALCGNPDFLVLDEPINGLDPQGIIEIRELILKLNREKQITVLISSHILDELSKFATHYGFIDKGKILCEMSAEELEAKCRKCVRLKVTDMKALAKVLDEKELEYKIIDEEYCDVYSDPNLTDITLALINEHCELLSADKRDESLESFFIGLTGGEQNA